MTRPLCVRRPPRPRGGCGGARPGRPFNCATLCPRESSAYLVSPGTTLSQRATLWRRRKRVAIRRLLITVQKVLYRVSERHAPQAQRATTEIIRLRMTVCGLCGVRCAGVWAHTHGHAHTFGFHTSYMGSRDTSPDPARADSSQLPVTCVRDQHTCRHAHSSRVDIRHGTCSRTCRADDPICHRSVLPSAAVGAAAGAAGCGSSAMVCQASRQVSRG